MMSDARVRITSLERRMALLEREMGDGGAGAAGARLAYIAGLNLYREPPPSLPIGPVPVRYRVLSACGTGTTPLVGAVIVTYWQGLVVDRRSTTVDGYATFGGVEGVGYDYTITPPNYASRAISNVIAPLGANGVQITAQLPVASPGVCITGCDTPVAPPYVLTDPVGTHTIAGNFTGIHTVVRTMPAVAAAPGCGALGARSLAFRYTIGGTPSYGLQVDAPSCQNVVDLQHYPKETTAYTTPVISGSDGTATIQCAPFKLTWTISGAFATKVYGVDPATITLELAP